MVAVVLTGCTTWDDPTTENYGAGPSIEVSVAAAAPTDSAFVISIVPGEGTTYYAYILDANDEAEEVDAATLLKGGYGNPVVNTSKYPTLTIPVDGMAPNTTYQVYAVASNDKGIVGKVANASIKTTDSGKPTFVSFAASTDEAAATATFNQAIARGAGKVSGVYYKEFDWENPVALTEEDITVTVSGNKATFATPDVPAGAYVLVSWEEGTFVDPVGNKCAAFASTYNEATDRFSGVAFHVANVNWDIADAYVTPGSGPIGDWEGFTGTITMPFDIFSIAELIKTGDLTVTYANENRTVSYKLSANQWKAAKQSISFVLPVEPTVGDVISVAVKGGILYDVYGNVNNAYSSEKVVWKYAGFIPTVAMITGTFNMTYQSYFDKDEPVDYTGTTVTIEEDPENTEIPNALVIKNLYLEGSEVTGYYDLSKNELYVATYEILGIETDEDGSYGLISINWTNTQADWITFTINKDGSLTSKEFGVYAYNAEFSAAVGWWEAATITTLTKAAPVTAAHKAIAKNHSSKKVNKLQLANKRIRK